MVAIDPIAGSWVNILDERRCARSIDNRFIELRNYRMWYETYWRAMWELIIPEREVALSWYNNNFGASASGADQRGIINRIGNKMFDLTAPSVLLLLAAGIQGYYVGRQDNWFKMGLPNRDLMQLSGVRGWVQEVQRWTYIKMQEGTFHDQLGSFILDGCSTGTATQYVERDERTGKYVHTTIHPLNVYLDKNHLQQIDTVYRILSLTKRQAIQRFGHERLSKRIMNNRRSTTQFKFIHAVFPRTDVDPEMGLHPRQFGSVLESDATYISIYKEMPDLTRSGDRYGFAEDSRDFGGQYGTPGDRGADDDQYDRLVHVGGHWEFPYLVWRWDVDSENIYGIGPFQKIFPTVKQLNDYAKLMKQSTLAVARPPWIAPTSLKGQLKLYPDGVNLLMNPQERLEPIQRQLQHYPFGVDREDRMAGQLRESTGVDFFLLHSAEQTRQLTATEVWEKQGEKAAVLTSNMGRLGNDYLAQNVDWYYYQEKIRGNLPPPPEALMPYIGGQYGRWSLRYIGPLAQAQMRHAKLNWIRTLENMLILAQVKPESLDVVDVDFLQRAFAEDSLPEEAMRTVDEIRKLREARAEREEIMQRLEELESLAKSYRNAGGAEGVAAGQQGGGAPQAA